VSTSDKKIVRIHLRDTILHMDGSLDALCKGFNVPKKWRKIDFPIRMVTSRNCYHPRIKKITKPYGENDVKALAYIIVKINQLLGDSEWEPANLLSNRPPITQFLTSMGVVRQSTLNHFRKVTSQDVRYRSMYPSFEEFQPRAIDVPALRVFLESASIGGRVCCMAKSYSSPYWGKIVETYLKLQNNESDPVSSLAEIYQDMRRDKACMVVLDVTSLYPTAQSYCPMPLGGLRFINEEACWDHINSLECSICDHERSLCDRHKYTFYSERHTLRPFSIILVRDVTPTQTVRENSLYSLCGRKSYNNNTKTVNGIEYSFETSEEHKERVKGHGFADLQSFTNVDLYWMRRAGYEFHIVCGIEFEVGMTYNSFIEPAFQKRIEAKRAGNRLLANSLKKCYNGAYGVTIQKDITEGHSLVTLPEDFQDRSPLDNAVVGHLVRNGCLDASEELTGEFIHFRSGQSVIKKRKTPGIGEYYADQSPLQIGCAILSYARHIVNLMMFNYPQSWQTYTDTDSDCVSELLYQSLMDRNPDLINNTDEAPMGSYKNDHAENNGTEPRVVFALYGTKKAKMYVTLNAEGELRVFNTFKGLKPVDYVDGKKLNPTHAEYIISKSLYEIGVSGCCESQMVTSWNRSLSSGVSINDHWQKMDSKTYLGHSKGTKIFDGDHGTVEFFVPYGSLLQPDYPIQPSTFFHDQQQVEIFEFQPANAREQNLTRLWNLHTVRTGSSEEPSYKLVKNFLDVYYEGCDEEYKSTDPGYYKILQEFEEINESIMLVE
jgi:hypothetical protein